jgi:3-O-methylgallate 3,4-dioxygenase
MAKIVGGFASGHTPLMSYTRPDLWFAAGQGDQRNTELVRPPACERVTYEELLAGADPKIATLINEGTFASRIENIQAGQDELRERFRQLNPDIVVMFGSDQSELFFDDNYPTISVYWGEIMKMKERRIRGGSEGNKIYSLSQSGLHEGEKERDYPVESPLALHIIESLIDQDFDVGQMRYMKDLYGGSIGPSTYYLDVGRSTEPRAMGMPHAFAFPVGRWFGGLMPPMVPISINACYPPNWISPRRSYALCQAVRKAVEAWDTDKRVAFATSGGLSHYVVDDELDRLALGAMAQADGEFLSRLPRTRLQSATTEICNWICVAGAMGETKMDVINYEPGYRSPAGTGCGCGCGSWLA